MFLFQSMHQFSISLRHRQRNLSSWVLSFQDLDQEGECTQNLHYILKLKKINNISSMSQLLVLIALQVIASNAYLSYSIHKIQNRQSVSSFSPLYVSPENLDTIADSMNQMTPVKDFISGGLEGFTQTITSRTVGIIIGNILAAVALKLLFDYVWFQSRQGSAAVLKKVTEPFESIFKKKEVASRSNIPSSAWGTLLVCIFIDLIGDSSFVIPGVGELEDAVWAPISAFLLSNLFGSNILTTLDFMKEALPGTDILPVAVTAWTLKYLFPESPVSKLLGIKTDLVRIPTVFSKKDDDSQKKS